MPFCRLLHNFAYYMGYLWMLKHTALPLWEWSGIRLALYGWLPPISCFSCMLTTGLFLDIGLMLIRPIIVRCYTFSVGKVDIYPTCWWRGEGILTTRRQWWPVLSLLGLLKMSITMSHSMSFSWTIVLYMTRYRAWGLRDIQVLMFSGTEGRDA